MADGRLDESKIQSSMRERIVPPSYSSTTHTVGRPCENTHILGSISAPKLSVMYCWIDPIQHRYGQAPRLAGCALNISIVQTITIEAVGLNCKILADIKPPALKHSPKSLKACAFADAISIKFGYVNSPMRRSVRTRSECTETRCKFLPSAMKILRIREFVNS